MTAHARSGDPDTSHAAARSVSVTRGKRLVMDLFIAIGHPVTHEELVAEGTRRGCTLSPSGIRSRCAELVEDDKVIAVSKTLTKSRRSAYKWALPSWGFPAITVTRKRRSKRERAATVLLRRARKLMDELPDDLATRAEGLVDDIDIYLGDED